MIKRKPLTSLFLLAIISHFSANTAKAGTGSQSDPYTCAEVINLNNPGTKAWINGYIVGTMNTKNNPYEFQTKPPFTYYANVYLADNPYETNPDNCIPVQLVSGTDARQQVNLGDNPGNHHCLYALQGDLVEYFGQPGLKNTSGFVKLADAPEDPTGDVDPALVFELNVSTPGSLQSEFMKIDADAVQGLVIKGKINGEDLIYLTSNTGRMASVKYLDLANVTFDYDGKAYAWRTKAPEAGMGIKYNYTFILSEENYDETLSFDFVTGYNINCYRNNLASLFYNNKRIETVILPDFLTSLGEEVFSLCSNLKSVSFPSGLERIGDYAFNNCTNLVIKDIPSSLKRIGKYAFEYVTISQEKLKFENVKIGEGAFAYTQGVKSLEIINPTDSIYNYSFKNCRDLQEIKIGEGLKYIGYGSFYYCKNLNSAELPMSLSEVGEDTFKECPFVKSLPTEGYIRYMGGIAYELADSKRSVYTVREGTKMLAPRLFCYSGSSMKVNLPKSLEIFGKESMSQVDITTLPELSELRRIDDRAFDKCPLTNIVIPEKVELIHPDAFMSCDNVWKVTFKAVDCYVGYKAGEDYSLFNYPIERVDLGDKVQHIPSFLFSRNNVISDIKLPQSVVSLSPYAFSGCSKLESINLNDNIVEFPDYVFSGCSSLKEIHWPAKLKKIGQRAFDYCTSLETVSVPEGCTTIGYSAFLNCPVINKMYLPSTLVVVDHLGLKNFNEDHFTLTCTAETPYDLALSFMYMAPTTIRVSAASLEKYKSDPQWNGEYYPQNRPEIIAIETISALKEDFETSFSSSISSDSDLSDTVVDNVYITLGESDGYDESDGSIVLNEAMDEQYIDAVGGMVPGESDLANRFNGLVIQVPAGSGKVAINCLTVGDRYISVKIGNGDSQMYQKDSKGDVIIEYDVDEDTYIYIYATEGNLTPQNIALRTHAVASAGCVKIFSIGINPEIGSVGDIIIDESGNPIIEYWRIDGMKVYKPQTPGIYIGRRLDGSSIKIYIR